MSFPSSVGTKKNTQADTWQRARSVAGSIKTNAINVRDTSAAGTLSTKDAIDLATLLADAKSFFLDAMGVPGIEAYVRDQIDDQSFDLPAEFTAMMNGIDGTVTWIKVNFPQDAQGYLLAIQFTADGHYTYRVLTAGQTAGLRTQLNTLIATID